MLVQQRTSIGSQQQDVYYQQQGVWLTATAIGCIRPTASCVLYVANPDACSKPPAAVVCAHCMSGKPQGGGCCSWRALYYLQRKCVEHCAGLKMDEQACSTRMCLYGWSMPAQLCCLIRPAAVPSCGMWQCCPSGSNRVGIVLAFVVCEELYL